MQQAFELMVALLPYDQYHGDRLQIDDRNFGPDKSQLLELLESVKHKDMADTLKLACAKVCREAKDEENAAVTDQAKTDARAKAFDFQEVSKKLI